MKRKGRVAKKERGDPHLNKTIERFWKLTPEQRIKRAKIIMGSRVAGGGK